MADSLSIRMKRLTLDPKRQQELIEEIEHASKEKLAALEKLLDDHDQECLQILNQKLKEKKDTALVAVEKAGHEIKPPMPTFREMEQFFSVTFSSPEKFAAFVEQANDEVLAALEDTVLKMAKPEKREKLTEFFKQIRVHRSFVEKSVEQAYKKALIEEIKRKESQMKELNAAMAAVEKEMKIEEKKK